MHVGDKLTAINECKMHNDGRPTLTIGKEYVVEDINTHDFAVMDDEDDFHWFPISGVNEYFNEK